MEKLILVCIDYLRIKNPVEIRFVTRLKFKNTRAYHISWEKNGKTIRHVIRVKLVEDGRDSNTIVAHEFVHAWQAEYAKKSKTHGFRFQNKAFDLRDYLISEGFDIAQDIYCPLTDK